MKYVFLVDCENIPVVKFNGNIVRAFNISNKNEVVIYAFHNNAMLTETHTDSVTYIPIDTYRLKAALVLSTMSYQMIRVTPYLRYILRNLDIVCVCLTEISSACSVVESIRIILT